MKIKNRQQVLGIIALTGVALFAADRFVFTPVTAAWKDRSAKIADLTKSINQGEQQLTLEESRREKWESMRTNTLPSNLSTAESQVLRAFERWSQDSRISISSIKPQWKQAGDDYMTLECRADASGSMDAITRFLFELEKDPTAFKVESIELSSRDNDGQQLSLGLQVSALLLNAQEP